MQLSVTGPRIRASLTVLLAVAAAGLCQPVRAAEISTLNSNARALGMGDAYAALANDSSALFYNPAGLARVRGLNWKIFEIRAAASGLDAYRKIADLNAAGAGDGFAEKIDELYGEHVSTGLGGETSFTAPMFGFAIYDHADALVRVDNPVYPELYTSVINDFGYVVGFGAPLSPFLHLGLDLKYIKRTGARVPFAAAFLADLDPELIASHVTGWGVGYGADLGMNIVVPAPFFRAVVSTVWRNVGQMRFTSEDPNTDIPYEDNDLTLGLGLDFDLPLVRIAPAIDFRYINSPEYQLTRKINFGVEVGLPLVDIRGGFREGYYTYGLGLNLGLFRVDAASYGVELGAYPGQIEDRRYVVQFTMELGVGDFSADGSSSGGAKAGGGSGSAGGSGGSKSIWGSGRLKRRR